MALQKTPDGICWESIGSTTQPVTVDMYSNFDGELHCYQARGWIPKESHGFCHVWTDPDPEKKKKFFFPSPQSHLSTRWWFQICFSFIFHLGKTPIMTTVNMFQPDYHQCMFWSVKNSRASERMTEVGTPGPAGPDGQAWKKDQPLGGTHMKHHQAIICLPGGPSTGIFYLIGPSSKVLHRKK